MTKPFLALLSITLILGVALGGAFVGGIVLGKSQSANAEQTVGPARLSAGPGAQFGGQRGGQTGRDRAAAARQGSGPQGQGPQGAGSPAQDSHARAESSTDVRSPPVPGGTAAGRQEGQISAQPSGQPAGRGNGPQSAPGSGQPPVGGPGRGGVAGTIESVDGEKLTITTPRGAITVTAGAEMRIVSFSEGTAEDLSPGSQVRVLGPRTPEGDVQANSILIVPPEAQAFFGRRPGPRRP
jgi:hypothetical protein